MTEIRDEIEPRAKRRSWRIVAITAVVALFATVGLAAVADSMGFRVRGGNGNSAMVNCAGGMDRLSQPFDEGFTTIFPGDPEVMVEIVNTIPVDFFLLEKITTGTHGGTHVDAPRHFVEGGRSIDQLDATEFVMPAYVIDVRDRVAAEGPDFQLEKADIRAYERANGKIKEGSMVIIFTGHQELFGTPLYNGVRHPGFSGDAVNWMIEKRHIDALGSDGLGPDASLDANFEATFNMLAADGITVPGLNNLETMAAKGDIIIASAVPLVGGSGFQTDPLACHGNRGPGNNGFDYGDNDDDDDEDDD